MKRPNKKNRIMGRVRSSDGSVSIFLIIALSMVFMFVAVFIDYARVAAMKVQSERLARAAVRSVMSSYDPQLQQEYGLYAFGDSSGDFIMGKMLNESLSPGERGDAFHLLPLELDSSGLSLERPLGKYNIFNRQISEDMKYKAPIDFTLELVNKFKPLSQSMKEASNAVDVLKKLRKLYDKREEALDDMLAKQRKAGEIVEALSKLIMNPPGSSITDTSLGGGIRTAADAAAQYNDYVTKSEEDAARPSDEEKLYTDLIQSYLDGVSSMSITISLKVEKIRKEQDKLLNDANERWEEAQQLNEEMKQVIKDAENRSETEGYDQVTRDNTPGSDGSNAGDAEMIVSIRQQAEKLIHSEELLNGLKSEISTQKSRWDAVDSQVSGLLASMGGSGMMGSTIRASSSVQDYVRKYGIPGNDNIPDRELAMLEQFRSSDKERKATEKKAQMKLKEAAKVINAIGGSSQQSNEIQEQFRELQRYYNGSLTFNEGQGGSGEAPIKGKALDNDPYDAGKSSMDEMDSAYGSMGNMLNGIRDELFQNEYAVHYFQHFDITRLEEIVRNPASADQLSEEFAVGKQEVEYILYGFHNPAGNVAAAYAEIFASRLAIRTMEGFVVNSKMGNPLLILAAAILYGIEKAIEDMIQLCQKGSIQLSKYVPVEITYRDHLRMFLFIHSNNEKKMSRMLALIRLNTGVNPADRGTYASGEIVTGIRLWFLPGITKALGSVFDSGTDQVEGNRYVVTRNADFSY
ncbi:hypothetical protein SAMN05661091_1015 [Paenibacillus uliginis N3/975]|uniref:Flp pilus-assembly TadE/G-like n=1 Tax=Paenibacillus uliginis N3/975 TaxID=1313296 RepID=A0A1X7GTT2_9BACL|nr:hypothetical protein [Paenibacillus uliginis]SMF73874.1 hypothetical protein SAMN05661091_1015 [Paenibacillus uliginis N3/975]